MDNIEFKKIWSDTDFYQIQICAINNYVNATTISYVVASEIEDLAKKISDFTSGDKKELIWEIGNKNDIACPYISLSSNAVDKFGHVLLDIYMQLSIEEIRKDYHCCLPIYAEIGMLDKLSSELLMLNEASIGFTAATL